MRGRHSRKAPKFRVARGLMAGALILALSICSVVTVTANTVTANVVDGEQSYTFHMDTIDLDQILDHAVSLGLEPLGPLDVAERVENTTTVNVRRGVSLTVTEAGKFSSLVAYVGDTVEKALEDNNILLKAEDEVTPSRETLLEEDTAIQIRRACQVSVTADGKTQKLSLVGATVAQALEKAGVTLGEKDSVNYEADQPVFDKMNIRVSRVMKITVTADGETKEYDVAADTVEAALKKCGVKLGEEDRLNVAPTAKLTDGMAITVQRVTTQEVTETETVPYDTEYEYSDELYEDQTETRTPGVEGEKEVTYKVTYVDGEEESREAVSEKVTKEPTTEVVVQGTKEYETYEPETPDTSVPEGNGTGNAAGTFTDMYGNQVAYSSMLSGTCTAYSVPGGTTSLGWDAVYGVIAVNPNIIPYGTRMYITSPDGSVVYGYGVAGDTGGACMAGDIIADLCYNTIEECSQIGRRTMNIYILA